VEGGREAEDGVVDAEALEGPDVLLEHQVPLLVKRRIGRERTASRFETFWN
jgi:hypothetical protein